MTALHLGAAAALLLCFAPALAVGAALIGQAVGALGRRRAG